MAGSATFGSQHFAETIFAQFEEEDIILDNPDSGINPRNQIGFGLFGQRAYLRPENFDFRPIDVGDPSSPDITITTTTGAFIGKIRTDIQFTTLKSLKFGLIDGLDCADFTMELNKIPDFPIPAFSFLTFNISGRVGDWYKGLVLDTPQVGTQRNTFTYKGFGLRLYTKELSADIGVLSGTGKDVGQVFEELVTTRLIPETPIIFNAAKINNSTGVIIVNDLDFGKYKLNKVFDTLAIMSGHIWGVDGDGEIYFKPAAKEGDAPERTFFIGYDVQNFRPKLNLNDVKNSIVVQRQEGRADGAAGWIVGGIFSDESSVAKFGKKELEFQVPGFFEQPEIELIGNSLLASKKDPKFVGMMDGFRIKSGLDFLEDGLYRLIMPNQDFPVIFSDVDDASEWAKTGAGDLTVVDEDKIFTFADGGIKLNYTDAALDQIVLTGAFKGSVKRIRVFIRSNRKGSHATLGVGKTTAFENTKQIDFPVVNQFYNFDWDVSDLNIVEINKVGIRIDEVGPVASTDIFIDKIEFEVVGHKFYKMPLSKSIYTFSPSNITARAEFGILPPKMENFLAGLFSTAKELKFTQEIRT